MVSNICACIKIFLYSISMNNNKQELVFMCTIISVMRYIQYVMQNYLFYEPMFYMIEKTKKGQPWLNK